MMKSNDTIITVLGMVFFVVTFFAGAYAESKRIYEKCLTKNSEMVYSKAVELCKEQVK